MSNTIGRRPLTRLAPLLALAVVAAGGGTARAQWGWGWGGGWGFGGGGYLSNAATLANINQRSASAANYAYSIRQNIPGTGNVYAHNPNSYMNHVRDTSFFQRYDVSTRRTSGEAIARRATSGASGLANNANRPEGNQRPAPPPLAHFFSAAGVLVWPREAPVDGNLGSLKDIASQAAAGVQEQVKAQGFAPVGQVSDARTKLVDYGTPALNYLNQHTTPAVVDAFHQFLLSLYDALGTAASGSVTR